MDEFFNGDQNDDNERRNAIWSIKFFENGQAGSVKCTIQVNRRDDDSVWKVKKRLLKKLKYKDYKSA